MKREIKFRAWDELNKIMHFDFQFIKSGDEDNDWIIFISDKQPLGWDEIGEQSKPHPFNNPFFAQQLQIMQFTGLKDKNRKEIYEGDIIKLDDPNWGYGGMYDKEHDGYFYREVALEHGCFCFKNGSKLYNVNRQSEIIGNIYENPELL